MGKKAPRPVPATAPPPVRKFRLWQVLSAILVVVLGVGVLVIGRGSEPNPPRNTNEAGIGKTQTAVLADRGPDPLHDTDDTPPEMVRIPEGSFWMGRDNGPFDEKPAHEVTVSAFDMDATE